MTDLLAVQKEWLRNHPQHERWHPLPGIVTLEQWTDHVWVMPDGSEVTEAPRWMDFGGMPMASAANTLWVDPIVLHAARKYQVV